MTFKQLSFAASLPVEVCHNDGYWQCDAEDTTNGAERGNQFAGRGLGRDVPIASAGHGDDRPVQRLGQGVEHCVRLVLLQGIAQASEDQHAHAHRHAQQQ